MGYTATHNLETYKTGDTFKGETFHMNTLVDEVSTPIDLTGVRIRMDIRTAQKSPLLLRLTNYDTGIPEQPGGGLEITDPTNGYWKIKPRVISLQPATYIFDIEFTWPSSEEGAPDDIQTLIEGNWIITQDTTHD